jgi:uncharacterized protein (TIRG00374 family)
MSGRALVRPLLGLGLAVLFAYLFMRQMALDELLVLLSSVQLGWVMAGLLLFLLGYGARIARWRLMLALDNPGIAWQACAGPLLASFALNNLLPLRLGDIARAFAFSRSLGVGSTQALATLLVERLLDLLIVLAILGVALQWFSISASKLLGLGGLVLLALALGILLLLCAPRICVALARLLLHFLTRLLPGLSAKLGNEVDKAELILTRMASKRVMSRLLAWSCLVWLAEGGVYWLLAKSLTALSQTTASWLALPVGTLSTLIPSTPGYVGTFDYFTMQAMLALGNEAAAAGAYALLVHALLWLPVTVLGGLYLMLSPVKKIIFSTDIKQ